MVLRREPLDVTEPWAKLGRSPSAGRRRAWKARDHEGQILAPGADWGLSGNLAPGRMDSERSPWDGVL